MFKKRIVVADEDQSFRFLVESMLKLSDQFVMVGSYAEPMELVKNLLKDKPDLIVTDIYFPDLDPREYLRQLQEKNHLLDVLIMTDYQDATLIVEMISLGAAGYILKKNKIGNLYEAIQAVADGGSPLDFSIARKLITHMQVTKSSPLTRQESNVLRLITQGKTYSMIADELSISNETSKTHIKNIYRKLEVNSKTDAVRKAFKEKLVHV
jgi:DNA-binding NarL/FixJ family response regulator